MIEEDVDWIVEDDYIEGSSNYLAEEQGKYIEKPVSDAAFLHSCNSEQHESKNKLVPNLAYVYRGGSH